MIPKIIHYCWFGGNEKSDLIKNCIASWKKYCPDYQIVEWNEDNVDLNACDYIREAYNAQKWAFVSDYVRIWALYNYGGIYLDTDVEIKKNMDAFLTHNAFTGFEDDSSPFTAVFGCSRGFTITKTILDSYKVRHFLMDDGSYDMRTNTQTVTDIFVSEYGVQRNNSMQIFDDGLAIYPKDYFCPKSYVDNKVYSTENTFAIHWFDGSWQDIEKKQYHKKEQKLTRLFGTKIAGNILGIISQVKKEGLYKYLISRFKKYVKKG